VQVIVHDVKAQFGRLGDAKQSVKVRPVAIHQPARAMHQAGDLQQVLIEQPQRVGVGQHHAHDALVQLGAQVVETHIAPAVRGDLHHLKASHCGRGRVGAVSRVGDQDARAAIIAFGLMVGTHDQHARQLTMGAGRRL